MDLPKVGDFVPGYEADHWYGIVGPKHTPAGIVDRLNKEVNASFGDATMKARLPKPAASRSPDAFSKLIRTKGRSGPRR